MDKDFETVVTESANDRQLEKENKKLRKSRDKYKNRFKESEQEI